jgi:hypothetical protein
MLCAKRAFAKAYFLMHFWKLHFCEDTLFLPFYISASQSVGFVKLHFSKKSVFFRGPLYMEQFL